MVRLVSRVHDECPVIALGRDGLVRWDDRAKTVERNRSNGDIVVLGAIVRDDIAAQNKPTTALDAHALLATGLEKVPTLRDTLT